MKKLTLLLFLLLFPLINAGSISFIYPDNWERGSEITLIVKAFDESEPYAPTNITFNKELDGIYLNEIKNLDNQVRLFFLISQQAELGKKTLKLTIDNVEKEITINIVDGITISQEEEKIFGLRKEFFFIMMGGLAVIVFTLIIITTLIIDSKTNN